MTDRLTVVTVTVTVTVHTPARKRTHESVTGTMVHTPHTGTRLGTRRPAGPARLRRNRDTHGTSSTWQVPKFGGGRVVTLAAAPELELGARPGPATLTDSANSIRPAAPGRDPGFKRAQQAQAEIFHYRGPAGPGRRWTWMPHGP